MTLTFAAAWDRVDISTGLSVSDGTSEPADTSSLEWAAWRSHNFSGTVAAKLDGPPRALRIAFDTLVGSFAYDVAEDDRHQFELLDPTADDLRAARWADAQALQMQAQAWGCETPFGRVQTDADSLQKVNGLALMALIAKTNGTAFSVDFTLADNSNVTLDADQTITLGQAVGAHVMACHDTAQTKREALLAAPDPATVLAVDVEGGWPDAPPVS